MHAHELSDSDHEGGIFHIAAGKTSGAASNGVDVLSDSDCDAGAAAARKDMSVVRQQRKHTRVNAVRGNAKKRCKPAPLDLPGLGLGCPVISSSYYKLPPCNAIEVCAGVGNLTTALNVTGFKAVGLDMSIDLSHDLLNASFVDSIKRLLGSGVIRYMHIAPPCNTYSVARYPKLRPVCCCQTKL